MQPTPYNRYITAMLAKLRNAVVSRMQRHRAERQAAREQRAREEKEHKEAVAELVELIRKTREEADAFEAQGDHYRALRYRALADLHELRMRITLRQ